MIALEYYGPAVGRLTRARRPLLPLYYWQISHVRQVPKQRRIGWKMEGLGPYASYAWPLAYRRSWISRTRLLEPSNSAEFITVLKSGVEERVPILQDNYLLITRIPNVLHPNLRRIVTSDADPSRWPYLTVIVGGNGLGTRGIGLLLESHASS